MRISANVILGDCKEKLKELYANSIDLIFTSPPYDDSRKNTYRCTYPDEYVEWFLLISNELLRILIPFSYQEWYKLIFNELL